MFFIASSIYDFANNILVGFYRKTLPPACRIETFIKPCSPFCLLVVERPFRLLAGQPDPPQELFRKPPRKAWQERKTPTRGVSTSRRLMCRDPPCGGLARGGPHGKSSVHSLHPVSQYVLVGTFLCYHAPAPQALPADSCTHTTRYHWRTPCFDCSPLRSSLVFFIG